MRKLLLTTALLACALVSGGPAFLPAPGTGPFGPPPPCGVTGAGNTVCTGAGCTPALASGKSRYVFLSSGTLTSCSNKSVRYCLIAGGGSGGSFGAGGGGGGGGGGGMLFGTGATLSAGAVTIGPGGLGVDSTPAGAVVGNPGGNTSAPLTGIGPAIGGGFGAGLSSNGGNGGSGGGGYPGTTQVGGQGTPGPPVQGKNGGNGNSGSGAGQGGGGGGGGPAGTVGGNAVVFSNSGNGGAGDLCPIDNVRYSGGGGGGQPNGTQGTGGAGGGMQGGGAAAAANTGGGSGGAGLGIPTSANAGSGKAIFEEL